LINTVKELESKLKNLHKRKVESKEHVDLLVDLAWEMGLTDEKRAKELTKQARNIVRKLKYRRGKAYCLRNESYFNLISSNLEKALKEIGRASTIFKELNDEWGEATALDIHALIFWRLGNFDKALVFAFDGLQLNKKIENARGQAWALHNIAAIYFGVGDHSKAIEFYHKAKDIFKKIKYKIGQSQILAGLGAVYKSLEELPKALQCYKDSLEISQQFKIQIGISRAYNEMGSIFQQMGKINRARMYYRRSLNLYEHHDYKEQKAYTLYNLSTLCRFEGNIPNALKLLHEALALIKHAKAKPTGMIIHKELSEIYQSTGDHNRALKHFQAFHKLREKVFNEESNITVKNLQIRSEVEVAEKEAEIHRLKYIELARMQSQLVQSEKMALLGKLVAGLAHEVNTPVGVIKSNINVAQRALKQMITELKKSGIMDNKDYSQPVERALNILETNQKITLDAGDKIASLIDNLKDFAKLDEAEVQFVDINELIQTTLQLFSPEPTMSIEIMKELNPLPGIKCKPTELNQVFMTILINAAEAITDKGIIKVITYADGDNIHVKISDSGRGIPADRLKDIFEIGFSSKEAKVKFHVGLANSYNIIQQHGGQITASSELGKGSEFWIKLPVNNSPVEVKKG
jgi:signal transduction histidine kinase